MRSLFLLLIFCSTHSFGQKDFGQAENQANDGGYYQTTKSHMQGATLIRRLADDQVIVKVTDDARIDFTHFKSIGNEWKWAEDYSENTLAHYYVHTSSNLLGTLSRATLVKYDKELGLAEVSGDVDDIRAEVLSNPSVTFIQKINTNPKTESQIRQSNLGVNAVRFVHASWPMLNAAGLNVVVKEDAFDTLDIDIKGRSIRDAFSANQVSSHGTDMATLIAGAGNSFVTGRGAAKGARLYAESFSSLLPNVDSYFTSRNLSVENHSYGVGVENFYGSESVAFDRQSQNLPSLLHVFSVGNSGSQNGSGAYSGIPRFATLTGSFKQAKNVLIVTGTNEFRVVNPLNSAGPAYDGRIKPDISAFGGSGTSDAAALVTGATLLVQDYYKKSHGQLPSSDLVRSILLAGSDDIGNPGPDYISGYGQLNLRKSMKILEQEWFISEAISESEVNTYPITISEPHASLTVVLAWRDPPANAGDTRALVNDLDLKVTQNLTEWMPWVLNSSASTNALSALATKGVDRLNNTEMVTLTDVTPGTYNLVVTGHDIQNSQSFSLSYFLQSADEFVWTYPMAIDPLIANAEKVLYFDNSFGESGIVEIDYLTNNWTEVASISSGQTHLSFATPNIFSEAVFRFRSGNSIIKSDTFLIAPKPELLVALLCEDELVLNWDNLNSSNGYELLSYVDGRLVPQLTTQDTFAFLDRSESVSLYYTVRPISTHSKGVPDETIRIDQQGVGCYLDNFLVNLNSSGDVEIIVDVSYPLGIETLRILKIDQKDSVVFSEVLPDDYRYTFLDTDLTPGKTTYRAQLITESGLTILSEAFSLFTTDDKKYILFPNPVTNGEIGFLSPVTDAVFQILDTSGRPLVDFPILYEFEVFPINLSNGIYLYRVIKDGIAVKSGRFAVGG